MQLPVQETSAGLNKLSLAYRFSEGWPGALASNRQL